MTDESVLKFGPHKDKEMLDVPDDWLKSFWIDNYIQYNFG